MSATPQTAESPPESPSAYRWQSAKQYAEENHLELPECAPGTPLYLIVPENDRLAEIRLRAYARLIKRAGRRVKVLGGKATTEGDIE